MTNKLLNYTNLPDESKRKKTQVRILCLLVLFFGALTFLDSAYIEFLNYRAGSILPFRPRLTRTWRSVSTSERAYRQARIKPTGDSLWSTRPLTPAEQGDYLKWKSPFETENALNNAAGSVCVIIPLIILVCIGDAVAVFMEHSLKWRIALVVVFISQVGAIATVIHLDLIAPGFW